jgi:hypothetical protein
MGSAGSLSLLREHGHWVFHHDAIYVLGGGGTSFNLLVGIHAIGTASEYRKRTNKQ